ncbi:unnamed protein product [Durusdinium trenchii]|uniref:ACT domain-containing protein n=1 Tax=Durusdinium trenchii TaxID=1381693 RepID=A0ABP0KTG6_9DINO
MWGRAHSLVGFSCVPLRRLAPSTVQKSASGTLRLASTQTKGAIPQTEEEKKRVILTISGKVGASDGSDLWNQLAQVMRAADANIEVCGGTFVQMQSNAGANEEAESFSVSAFGACISPAGLPEGDSEDDTHLGCTMFMKAVLPSARVPTLMKLLQTHSPAQVYTASLSTPEDFQARSSIEQCFNSLHSHQQTGTIYLFGVDRPGQLAKITETLTRFGVGVSNLRVQSGSADSSKGDFVPCPTGGPLAENRIRIRFDNSSIDTADRLRKDIQSVGEELGYAVTCLTLDSHAQFRAFMPPKCDCDDLSQLKLEGGKWLQNRKLQSESKP